MMCSFAASVRQVAWEARLVIGAAGACLVVLLATPLPAQDTAQATANPAHAVDIAA